MTTTELEAMYQLTPLHAICIAQQGFCLHSLTWAQRCRLHVPYLSRGFSGLEYAASRDICLYSARQVIKTETLLNNSGLFNAARYKILGFLASVFMASVVVLLMDINHNKSSTQRGRLSGDILDATRILEHARHESETAAKFLESLMSVVKKHNVGNPASQITPGQEMSDDGAPLYDTLNTQGSAEPLPAHISANMLSGVDLGHMDIVHETPGYRADFSEYFNGLVQSFDQGFDVGSLDWDSMLSGLEPSMT